MGVRSTRRVRPYLLAVALVSIGSMLAALGARAQSGGAADAPPSTLGSRSEAIAAERQPATSSATGIDPQCMQHIDDAVRRVNGHLDRCEGDFATLERETKSLRAQMQALKLGSGTGGSPSWVADLPGRINELTRKLRPNAEPGTDPILELAHIASDIDAMVEERNKLRAALSGMEEKLSGYTKKEQAANAAKMQAIETEIASLKCSALSISPIDDTKVMIDGFVESDAAHRRLIVKAKEAAPQYTVSLENVVPLGQGGCVRKISDEWALVREIDAKPGEYEIEKGPAVANAKDRLPDSAEACAQAAGLLLGNGQLVRELQLKPEINIEVWMRRGAGIGLCYSRTPEQEKSWQVRQSVPDGTYAMLLIRTKR